MAQQENLTPTDLARLTDEERRSVELAAAATEGPWVAHHDDGDVTVWASACEGQRADGVQRAFISNIGANFQQVSVAFDADDANGDFIADARTAVPHLAAEVARLRGRIEKLERVAEAARGLTDKMMGVEDGTNWVAHLLQVETLRDKARDALRAAGIVVREVAGKLDRE